MPGAAAWSAVADDEGEREAPSPAPAPPTALPALAERVDRLEARLDELAAAVRALTDAS